jgi:hypothetical protein
MGEGADRESSPLRVSVVVSRTYRRMVAAIPIAQRQTFMPNGTEYHLRN